jgi:hypothetical protein
MTAITFTTQQATVYWIGGVCILTGIAVIWFFTRK